MKAGLNVVAMPTADRIFGNAMPVGAGESAAVGSGRRWLAAAHELCLVGVLYGLYRVGRELAEAHAYVAHANARVVHSLETQLNLPSGVAIQGWFSDGALHLANVYYVAAHFPVTVAFLVWGFAVRPRVEYVWARRLLVVQTFLALTLHLAIPLAPPRMFPEWGFRDTMATIGPSAYEGASAALSNQVAAMPSLHVGWAVLVAVVVARTTTGPLRLLAGGHAVITSLVVVVTANHWWSDSVVAVALLGIALFVFPEPGRQRRLRRPDGARPWARRGGSSTGSSDAAR